MLAIPPEKRNLAFQVGVAIFVTLCLSTWQFTKGLAELRAKADAESLLAEPPLSMQDWNEDSLDYRKIELFGRFDAERYFLISNQQHQGRPGYWVYGILNTDRGRFLCNRGWISSTGNVRELPTVSTPETRVKVNGVIWPPSTNIRTSLIDAAETWPVLLPDPDVFLMARRTGTFPKEIRLLPPSEAVLTAATLTLDFSAAKHISYAAQWLVIGTLVGLGFWYFVLRRQDTEED